MKRTAKLPEIHIDIASHNGSRRKNPKRVSTALPEKVKASIREYIKDFGVPGDDYSWGNFFDSLVQYAYTNGIELSEDQTDRVIPYIERLTKIKVNPVKPRSPSRITGKAPSKRLVARRKKNDVPGYYPNPIADKLAIWLNAGNDTYGNPRRLYVVVDTMGEVLRVIEEGYSGSSAVTEFYPGIAIVGQFSITPAQYRELKKQYKVKFVS